MSSRNKPVPQACADARRYSLTLLADEWEWDAALEPDTLTQARTAARHALEALIREELPGVACVYLLENGRRIGVWDWVAEQPYWTDL